ncbi:hypothetical protein ACFLW6_00130 [Chloroflexota bacterium]
MDREEILLKEYEVCQSYVNSLGNQFWVSMSIVIPINITAFGWIITKTLKPANCISVDLPILIILALIMTVVLWLFWLFFKRIQFLISINNKRMHEIESEIKINGKTVIEKGWWIKGLDSKYGNDADFHKLEDYQRDKIQKLSQKYQHAYPWEFWKCCRAYKPPRSWVINWLFVVAGASWWLLVVYEILRSKLETI